MINETCQTKHPSLTTALWTTFHKEIQGFIVRRVSQPADAEDILQDTFLRIHLEEPKVHNVKHKKAWAFTIARRAIADFYRTQNKEYNKVQAMLNDLLRIHEPLPSPEYLDHHEGTHDVHEEVLSWLRPMMDKLPDKYRIALQLSDVECLRQKDVAIQLGLSLSGAKSRVQRARKMLGETLNECCEIEFGIDARAISYRKRTP